MAKSKKLLAKLEINCYEDHVETIGEGNENAIIAGLAVLIEDDSEENKFNFYMKSAINALMIEMELSEQQPVEEKKPSKKKKNAKNV